MVGRLEAEVQLLKFTKPDEHIGSLFAQFFVPSNYDVLTWWYS
jgi:hypothetical protein